MSPFGTYSLQYNPPEDQLEAMIEMTISSEANLSEMFRFFESFLKAAGYQIDGKELTLERVIPDFSDFAFSTMADQSSGICFDR